MYIQQMFLSSHSADNPDVLLHTFADLLTVTNIHSSCVQIRMESHDELKLSKHWGKKYSNSIVCVSSSPQLLVLASLFFKATSRRHASVPSIPSPTPTSSASVVNTRHLDSSDQQRIALILHCNRYSSRKARYVEKYRPVLERMGFSCVYVMGYETVVGPLALVEDILYVPVKEGYERCNLKLYHAYMWCKQFEPACVLKIDDDITILKEATFQSLVTHKEDYVVVDITSCDDGISRHHVRKANDCKTPMIIKKSTYGVGGLHLLSSRALQSITFEDMTQTIFEDVNMGIAMKTHGWSMNNLQWIRNKVIMYEPQP